MISSPEMQRKAQRVLARLEAAIRDGTATPADRERAAVIRDHLAIWDWCGSTAPAAEVMPREPEEEPVRAIDPLAAAFADWWDRQRFEDEWLGRVADAFAWWYAPRGGPITEEQEVAILDELERRGMLLPEPAGMVITSLEAA